MNPLHLTYEDRLRGIVRRFNAIADKPHLMDTQLLLLIRAAALALSEQDARYAEHWRVAEEKRRVEGPVEDSERVMKQARGRA